MRLSSTLLTAVAAVSLSLAAPAARNGIDLPLPDGLPNPTPEQVRKIERQAHGTLPGLPLPANISDEGITSLQLIAFNELLEVAFFNELLRNVTNQVDGYHLTQEDDHVFILRGLKTILAQEEVHAALMANTALRHFGRDPIGPCRYSFPVAHIHSAINLAATLTDLVLGTLQDVTERFAANGDDDLIRLTAAIIGNKGEQEGWFRLFQGKTPSEVPALTTSDVNFAFSALQRFVVPASCPNIDQIDLRTFAPLDILTPPGPQTQKIKVSWTHIKGTYPEKLVWLAYINQLNVPIVVPLQLISCDAEQVIAFAEFPYDKYLMNGLTIAAVVSHDGPFPDAAAVAQATLFGPGLIVVE